MRENRAISVVVIAVTVVGCGSDLADQEYFAALDGEEKGMTREEQIAHMDRAIRLAPEQPPPRWSSGPRVALRVSGPAAARASFDRLWIDPR